MNRFRITYSSDIQSNLFDLFESLTEIKDNGVEEIMFKFEEDDAGKDRFTVGVVALGGGIFGAIVGLLMQYYISVEAYPLRVGGKGFFNLPSFIPVLFECIILFSVLFLLVTFFKKRYKTEIEKTQLFFQANNDALKIITEQLNELKEGTYKIEEI